VKDWHCDAELIDYKKLRLEFGATWAQTRPYQRTGDHGRPRSRSGIDASESVVSVCQCCNGLGCALSRSRAKVIAVPAAP
jgi:hypothetical protein